MNHAGYYFLIEARSIMTNNMVELILPHDHRLPCHLDIRLTQRQWWPAALRPAFPWFQ